MSAAGRYVRRDLPGEDHQEPGRPPPLPVPQNRQPCHPQDHRQRRELVMIEIIFMIISKVRGRYRISKRGSGLLLCTRIRRIPKQARDVFFLFLKFGGPPIQEPHCICPSRNVFRNAVRIPINIICRYKLYYRNIFSIS